MNNLIENFLQKLRSEDGLAINTISSYKKDLELFEIFLKDKKISLERSELEDFKQYLHLLYNKNLKSASISRKISCFKNFFQFLENEKIITKNPTINLETPKKDFKLPKALGEEEMFKLLDCANKDQSENGLRLACMLEVLYAAGLRVSELVSLPKNAIQFDKNYLIVKGKGSKERIAPLNGSAQSILKKYLKICDQNDSKWLFYGAKNIHRAKNPFGSNYEKIPQNDQNNTKNGKNQQKNTDFSIKSLKLQDKHITRQGFHGLLKQLAIKAGIDPTRVHPHVIRHSFASHLLNNGADLRILQELLGHSDISTTQIYTHILDSKLKDIVFKHHPLAKT